MKKRKAWLSRQRDGNFMFTLLKPIKTKVMGTEYEDFYIKAGEPLGLRYWCPAGVRVFFGIDIPIGHQVRIWVSGGIL